jgi:hypothetical protein
MDYTKEPLAVFLGPDEIRDALECEDEYGAMLETLSDKELADAAYAYLANEDEPWRFLERAAKQIVQDAHGNECSRIAHTYEAEIDELLGWKDIKSGVLLLLEQVILEERNRQND